MKDILIRSFNFNLAYAEALLDGVDDEMMVRPAGDGQENHANWTIGHLLTGTAMMIRYLDGEFNIVKEWRDVYLRKGPGDPRKPESASEVNYPSKSALMAEFRKAHEHLETMLSELPDERWNEPVEWRFQEHMPTLGDMLWFMCVTHESMHLGQLAGWRRAMGLPSALATL